MTVLSPQAQIRKRGARSSTATTSGRATANSCPPPAAPDDFEESPRRASEPAPGRGKNLLSQGSVWEENRLAIEIVTKAADRAALRAIAVATRSPFILREALRPPERTLGDPKSSLASKSAIQGPKRAETR